jgi:ATP-dependent RNA helicase RhlE
VALLEEEDGLSLVFVRTKRGADSLARSSHAAASTSSPCMATWASHSASARSSASGSGHATTLIATDVAARGRDLEAIGHVINFDPLEDIGYMQRVGRTGRAGRSGRGSTLVLPDQQTDVSRVAVLAGHKEQFERTGMRSALPKLVYMSRRGRRSRW